MKSKSGFNRALENCLDSIPAGTERVVLAFSGGIDSCVLLHLLNSNPRPYVIKLWHVNHGLQEKADEMEAFCGTIAEGCNLELEVSRLNIDPDTANLEAEARNARYALFEQALTTGDCLLTAHHADDQVETFLLNLLRGSGSAGLRGIADHRPIGQSILLRPLLGFSRAEIDDYARYHQLDWYDDPSNLSDRFNRNYLRHQVVPKIENRWPGYRESIRSAMAIQAETQQALNELGEQDFQQVRRQDLHLESDLLSAVMLLGLSQSRQKNLIRYWLKKYGCASLPQARLNELIKLLNLKNDSMPVVRGGGYEIRIYNRHLYIVYQDTRTPARETYDFKNRVNITISEMDLDLERQSIFDNLQQKDNGQSIKIKFRLNDKDSNPDNHRLKRLFQKHKIPPWKRPSTPQIYLDDKLTGLWF